MAANTVGGTYGHRVISYNLYDKSFEQDDYHYHNDFVFSKHTEFAGRNANEKYAIAESNVDEQPADSKTGTSSVSDYPESRVSLQSTTQFLHNEERGAKYGLDVLQDGKQTGKRIAQQAQVIQGTALKLSGKGAIIS